MRRNFVVFGVAILDSLGSVESEEIDIPFMGNRVAFRHDIQKWDM